MKTTTRAARRQFLKFLITSAVPVIGVTGCAMAKRIACPHCRGAGKCSLCGGNGKGVFYGECGVCKGTGKCQECQGLGF